MIQLSTAQLDAWIVAFALPLARILGFIASAPLWNTAGIPRRIRLILGLAIAITLIPALPAMPTVAPGSLPGLFLLGEQTLLGIAMGFAARIIFSAINLAGDFIGAQMGLSFATFYDPVNSTQTPVISELLNMIALLLFLALNGHLLYVATLAKSFYIIPVGAAFPGNGSWLNLVELGGQIFALGLLLSLPVVVALLIANLSLAVLTKAAPQLNIFALGFPITLLSGFVVLAISLNYLATPLQNLYELALTAITEFAVVSRGAPAG